MWCAFGVKEDQTPEPKVQGIFRPRGATNRAELLMWATALVLFVSAPTKLHKEPNLYTLESPNPYIPKHDKRSCFLCQSPQRDVSEKKKKKKKMMCKVRCPSACLWQRQLICCAGQLKLLSVSVAHLFVSFIRNALPPGCLHTEETGSHHKRSSSLVQRPGKLQLIRTQAWNVLPWILITFTEPGEWKLWRLVCSDFSFGVWSVNVPKTHMRHLQRFRFRVTELHCCFCFTEPSADRSGTKLISGWNSADLRLCVSEAEGATTSFLFPSWNMFRFQLVCDCSSSEKQCWAKCRA